MDPYETRYRQLLASGASAWAGDGFARTKIRQEETFHQLSAHGYLPASGAPAPELGCDNGVMAAQYLAKRDCVVPDVDVSEIAVHWAENRSQQTDLNVAFFVGNVCHLSQYEDVQFASIVDGSCLHHLLEDGRRCFFAEARRLLRPAGRPAIDSMCGLLRYAESLTTYNLAKHHLLKKGQPWRTLKPLPASLNKIQQAWFGVPATDVKRNVWWDRTIIVCLTDEPSADPQKS